MINWDFGLCKPVRGKDVTPHKEFRQTRWDEFQSWVLSRASRSWSTEAIRCGVRDRDCTTSLRYCLRGLLKLTAAKTLMGTNGVIKQRYQTLNSGFRVSQMLVIGLKSFTETVILFLRVIGCLFLISIASLTFFCLRRYWRCLTNYAGTNHSCRNS